MRMYACLHAVWYKVINARLNALCVVASPEFCSRGHGRGRTGSEVRGDSGNQWESSVTVSVLLSNFRFGMTRRAADVALTGEF